MNANIIISLMLAWYQTAGREGLKRAITVPQKDIEKICKRTGADVKEAVLEREKWVEETVNFIEELALKD